MKLFDFETQQKLLQEIADNTQNAIVITNAETDASGELKILYVNHAFEQMTGYTFQEVLGRSPKILQGPKTDIETTAKIRAAIQAASPVKVEILNYKKNGEEIWSEINLFPLLDSHTKVTHWVAINRLISTEDTAQARNLLDQERELTKLKSQFILMMSHESRTHLATVLSSVDLLERYGHCVSSEEKSDLYGHIREAVDRLVGLFSDVLVLEQSAEDYVTFNPAPLDLQKFCENLVSEVRQISSSDHKICLKLTAEPLMIMADSSLLYHIFSNLLSNAVKYSPEGGIIDFNVALSNQSIIFQVRDQGIGIPTGAMAHLFQSFYRADNVGYIAGTGLGLSIVKKMVEKHQGTIECRSEVNKGSTFQVVIPLQRISVTA